MKLCVAFNSLELLNSVDSHVIYRVESHVIYRVIYSQVTYVNHFSVASHLFPDCAKEILSSDMNL